MPIVGVLIGFIINGVRVAMLAVLAGSNQKMFEYWHSDKGEIFSIIAVLIFTIFFYFITRQDQAEYRRVK